MNPRGWPFLAQCGAAILGAALLLPWAFRFYAAYYDAVWGRWGAFLERFLPMIP